MGDFVKRRLAILEAGGGRFLFIGSMNMDGRSARWNTEVGLVIDSPSWPAVYRQLWHPMAAQAMECDMPTPIHELEAEVLSLSS